MGRNMLGKIKIGTHIYIHDNLEKKGKIPFQQEIPDKWYNPESRHCCFVRAL